MHKKITGKQLEEFVNAIKNALPKELSPDSICDLIEDTKSLSQGVRSIVLPDGIFAFRHITVNYGIPIERAISSVGLDHIAPAISSHTFSIKRKGVMEAQMKLIHFNDAISSSSACKKMSQCDYRPAGFREVLAFGKKYPNLQKIFPIVALGADIKLSNNFHCVMVLDSEDGKRILTIAQKKGYWHEKCRFAVVAKNPNRLF